MSRSVRCYHLSILFLCLATTQTAAVSIRVPNMAPTIQAAINIAASGDTILLASGTYTGSGNSNISLNGKQLVIRGEMGQANTIIDVQNQSVPAIRFEFGDPIGTIIEGITIRHAEYGLLFNDANAELRNLRFVDNIAGISYSRFNAADSLDRLIITGSDFIANDTGIYVLTNSAVPGIAAEIFSCNFENNERGLTYYSVEPAPNRYVSVTGSTFRQNSTAVSSFDFVHYQELWFDSCQFDSNTTAIVNSITLTNSTIIGGEYGIRGFLSSRAIVSNTRFEQIRNTALRSNVWGQMHQSKAPENYNPGFNLTDCIITNNPGSIASLGGFVNEDPVGATFTRCQLTNNGGGIFAIEGLHRIEFEDCLYADNGRGIEIRGAGMGLTIRGCTFANNNSTAVHSWVDNWAVTIERSIFYGNSGSGIRLTHIDEDSAWSISCCNLFDNETDYNGIPSQYGINGNFSVDPLFCSDSLGVYSLFAASLCASEHAACGVRIGAFDAECAFWRIDSLTVDTLTDNQHVLASMPVIFWQRPDTFAGTQTLAEVEVGANSDWGVAELWDPALFMTADTSVQYSGASLIDDSTYYLRVRIFNGSEWTEWKVISFRLNTAPTVPSPQFPVNVVAPSLTPHLEAMNATDPELDLLSYHFEVFADADTILLNAGSVIQSPGATTSWSVSLPLQENGHYFWRVRANDGYESSAWSALSQFWVNSVPEVPANPSLIYPPAPSGLPVYEMMPVFQWQPVFGPDPYDTVRYTFELATDSLFIAPIFLDSLSEPHCTLPDSLRFQTRYWWRVRSFDQEGLSSVPVQGTSFWTWTLGDINNNHKTNVIDLNVLVSFIFANGAEPTPLFITDVNGDCRTNVQDIADLVEYFFSEGPPAVAGCQ